MLRKCHCPGVLVEFPGAVAVGVSISVCPSRFTRDIVRREVVLIRSEHRDQLGARQRLEILLGDECDDLMTLVAPSEGVR